MPETAGAYDPRSEAAAKLAEYPYFTAKAIHEERGPGRWPSCEIGLFQHDADGQERQIGSYRRNYSFLKTFWWFRRGARHFALYSPNYAATRAMEIFPGSGFKDLGGEEPHSQGFCPAELFVPDCREYVSEQFSGPGNRVVDWGNPLASFPANCEFTKNPEKHRGRRNQAPESGEEKDYESGWVKFPSDHGFVAGCVWGDDSTWKIQYLDLSRVEEGVIRREERFGYIELPRSVSLRDAIDMEDLHETGDVSIAVSTRWNLLAGTMEPLRGC